MALWGTEKGKLAVNKLQKEVMAASKALVKFRQLCNKQPELGKNAGETVQILRASHPADAGVIGLGESTITPSTTIALATQTITVQEYTSRKIALTERMKILSPYNVFKIYLSGLTNNLAEAMDKDCGNAFTACKIKAIPTGTTAAPSLTFDTDGTVSTAATRNGLAWDIRKISREMEGTYVIDKYKGGMYACVMTPGFKFSIFGDAEYFEVATKSIPKDYQNGYLTSLYGIDFIYSNNTDNNLNGPTNFGDKLGTTSYEGEAVFCGADPVREIMVMPEHVREGELSDFQRSYGVALFAYAAYGEVWNVSTTREVKIIHFTST